jgi:hypothetical protein
MMDPNIDGRTNVIDVNVDGIDCMAPGELIAPSTYQKAQSIFSPKIVA